MKLLLVFSFLFSLTYADTLHTSVLSETILSKLLQQSDHNVTTIHTGDTYSLQEGWNHLYTPIDGLDVLKTFTRQKSTLYVVVYDRISQMWAFYTPDENVSYPNMLALHYLEAYVVFFVWSPKKMQVQIHASRMDRVCQSFLDSKKFELIVDSGNGDELSSNGSNSIKVASRYYSYHDKRRYDDTRIALIAPKLKKVSKPLYRYGPAKPKLLLQYAKEYENKKFYIYDYKHEQCYMGIFPSPKFPPFPNLKKL